MSALDDWQWHPDVVGQRPPRRPRKVRGAAGSVLFLLAAVVLVVLVWPAKWGGQFGTTVVVGHSMDGTYNTGDLLVTRRRPSYDRGQIIVYRVRYGDASGTVVHRIVAEEDGRFTTQGDNNDYPDPWPVTVSEIDGRPILRLPLIGWAILVSRTPLFLMALTGAIVTWLLWPRDPDESELDPDDPLSWDPPTGPAFRLAPPPPVSAFPHGTLLSPTALPVRAETR